MGVLSAESLFAKFKSPFGNVENAQKDCPWLKAIFK